MSINVPPVTGMTLAQVATELRVLIRDKIWHGLKVVPKVAGAKGNEEIFRDVRNEWGTNILKLRADLYELVEIAQRRRPSETRIKIQQMQLEGGSYSVVATNGNQLSSYGGWFIERFKAIKPDKLAAHAERAYALVQALPTMDNPSVGKAENTLRAVTAIIKVYHGLDVDKTMKDLPDVMEDLLKQIRPENMLEQVVPEPAPVHTDIFYIQGIDEGSDQGDDDYEEDDDA